MNRSFFSILRVILAMVLFCLVIASCANLPEQDENLIYTALAGTTIVHLTETYNALPPTVTPTATFTEMPTSTPTVEPPTLVPTAAEPLSTATLSVEFPDKAEVDYVLPSPNQFTASQNFNLTWVIKNIGKSNWSGKYTFTHTGGIQLANQDSFKIDSVIIPGGSLTVTMLATAPQTAGNYQTTWTLTNPDGIPFYNVYYDLLVGETTYITDVVIDVTSTPAALDWMCSDAERSNIQGSGCAEYCTDAVILDMATQGKQCYSNGTAMTVSN